MADECAELLWSEVFAPILILLRKTSSADMFVLLTDDPPYPFRLEPKALLSALFVRPLVYCPTDCKFLRASLA